MAGREKVLDGEVVIVEPPKTGRRGGARAGAGRKTRAEELQLAPSKIQYEEWKAKSERAKALTGELEFLKESGQWIPRDAVRMRSATAFAVAAQSLRSIPDHLERRFSLPPEVIENIGNAIDDIMNDLSIELENMCDDKYL